jgi:periodic tryptophan protein 2
MAQGMPSSATMPAFRALQTAVTKAHEDLASACDANLYTLRYLCAAGNAAYGKPAGGKAQPLPEAGGAQKALAAA